MRAGPVRRDGRGWCGVAPRPPPPPAPEWTEGLGDREVEFPVLRADQEALPFVAVEKVGRLAAILGIADRDSPCGEVRYFHAARSAACAALEPVQTGEVGVHLPLLPLFCGFVYMERRNQVSSRATCWISSTEAAGESAAARIRSKASAQARTSRSFSR